MPNLAAYDPAFAYEVATIVEDGIKRMYGPVPEDRFYYLTLYNENYEMPDMPEGAAEGIVRGLYRFSPAPEGPRRRATKGELHRIAASVKQGNSRELQSCPP